MADERNEREKNGPPKPSQPIQPSRPDRPGAPAIDPRVRIGVNDPNDKPVDEKEAQRGVARELDALAQKMAAGAGNTPEERAVLATEIEALKQKMEDAGVPVPQLEPVIGELRKVDAPPSADPKAEAHAAAVQVVAKARDDLNESLNEDDAEPKSRKAR